MFSKSVKIVSEVGLYGRSATAFIQLANTFKSTIFVEQNGKQANAKSLLGVLSLAIANNSEVKITAEGSDEEEAVNKLTDFISSGCSLPSESSTEDKPVTSTLNPIDSKKDDDNE